ncbi:MAG: APC family permease [Burkholderiales bacterium]|nr:APC family permease [Burkholderiales bacterium]
MAKKLGLAELLYIGIGSIVGSGWLMSSYIIAKSSGPAAILAWIFGGLIIAVIAINFVEVCAFLPPKNGGFGHYVDFTHNSFLSFICEWVFLLSWISLIPAEATATVQYLSALLPNFQHMITTGNGSLSWIGTMLTSFICIIFFILNYLSLAVVMKFIKYLTLIKILIPIFVAAIFLLIAHNFGNIGISSNQSFMPYGYQSLLASITTGGVVFAFIGFQTPITFAGDAKNPKKNIPLAILLSVIFCMLIYAILQVAYLIAIPPALLKSPHQWHDIVFSAPFFQLSDIYHLTWLTPLLSMAAFIAPFSAGLVFYASAVKMTVGFSHYLPAIVSTKSKNGSPLGGVLFVLFICILVLWFLPGWQEIVSIICVNLVLLFAIICMINGSLNQLIKKHKIKHGVYITGSNFFSWLGYIFSLLMYYWSAWPLTLKGLLVISCGTIIYLIYQPKITSFKLAILHIKNSNWFFIQIILITIISYLSSENSTIHISDITGQILTIIISTIFYIIGRNQGVISKQLQDYIAGFNRSPE